MSRICLCGSYDDRKEIYKMGRYLLKKHRVLIPAFYLGRRPTPEEQNTLMLTHFDRIKLYEKTLFIFNSKIGVNTLIELGYATACSKDIYIIINDKLKVPDEFTSFLSYVNESSVFNWANN